MEVKLDKQYPLEVSVEQAWAVLSDIRAVGSCMPGAQITEQLDDTHYKGTVKTKVGPASMQFGGEIEVLGIDVAARAMQMVGKGADRGGSSASMKLSAHIEPGATPQTSLLVGQATVTVSGKLAQFGSRLLVPVSDAMLAQFADNFRAAAAAVPVAAASVAPEALASPTGAAATPAVGDQPTAPSPAAAVPIPAAAAPVKELNALSLMWTVFKSWLAGLFGRKS
jgi:carbon monoxide dehydrogenase subunit G